MTKDELKRRALALIEPKFERARDDFNTQLVDLRQRRALKDWQRDRAAETAAGEYVRLLLRLVADALRAVLSGTHADVAEHDLLGLFEELHADVGSLKTSIYQAYAGLGLTTGVGVEVAIDRNFRLGVAEERAELGLLTLGAPLTATDSDLIFVSCGQSNDQERQLGSALARLVTEETNFRGYFAQNQQSLDGVSAHILGALGSCAGFVAVLHHRGTVSTPNGCHDRASVWVEQEIAIVSFRTQVLKHDLGVVAYIQDGIRLEGLRESILLNAIPFRSNDEVLGDFRSRLELHEFPFRVR